MGYSQFYKKYDIYVTVDIYYHSNKTLFLSYMSLNTICEFLTSLVVLQSTIQSINTNFAIGKR